jgi:hypothetical protein
MMPFVRTTEIHHGFFGETGSSHAAPAAVSCRSNLRHTKTSAIRRKPCCLLLSFSDAIKSSKKKKLWFLSIFGLLRICVNFCRYEMLGFYLFVFSIINLNKASLLQSLNKKFSLCKCKILLFYLRIKILRIFIILRRLIIDEYGETSGTNRAN